MHLVIAIVGASATDAQAVFPAVPQDTIPVAVVRAYVEAFNAGDLDSMMARVAPDMVWLHVSGDSLVVDGRGADAFRRLLDRYFREVPSARSELREVSALGPWVTILPALERYASARRRE
jgi:ketosteroid isomerase-like protein